MTRIILIAVSFTLCACSAPQDGSEQATRYTNTPTMGDAARAGGEKPF